MQYRAQKTVNLGGGQFLAEGQTADLPAGLSIPGLEPVMEKMPAANTLEHVPGLRSLDAPIRGRVVNG